MCDQLHTYGYDSAEHNHYGIYKIFPTHAKTYVKGVPWKYPFMDVFIADDVDMNGEQVVHYDSKNSRKTWPRGYFKKNELFPLRKYPFGKIEVYGPNIATDYLLRHYGKDWNTHGYHSYDHKYQKGIEYVKFKLKPEDRHPAQPIGPIKNNIVL